MAVCITCKVTWKKPRSAGGGASCLHDMLNQMCPECREKFLEAIEEYTDTTPTGPNFWERAEDL